MSRSTHVLCLALALVLLSSGFAQAQPRDDLRGRGHGRDRQAQRHTSPPPQARRDDDQRLPPPGWNAARRNDRDWRDERGAGPDHRYYRGQSLPREYRVSQYVVDDWRGHRLSPPPRGYHWVQAGGDYLLVAITTGVILQLLLND